MNSRERVKTMLKKVNTLADVDKNLAIAASAALQAFEGEEDSVKEEHKEVIAGLRRALGDYDLEHAGE